MVKGRDEAEGHVVTKCCAEAKGHVVVPGQRPYDYLQIAAS